MKFLYYGAGILSALMSSVAGITLTTTSTLYTVDAGSANSFVMSVNRASCDITSLIYRGTQVQYQSTYSHIASGLGSATVSASTITSGGVTYVKITCTTSTLIHYYVIRDTDSSIHMATYITAEPSVGELRYIFRLIQSVVPNDQVSQASDTTGGTAIEGSDVYLVSGQTRSKFYSSMRAIEDQVHCATGSTMYACMLIPGVAYETSAGGPFHRDINTNPSGSYNALYWYMNSGHVTTEAYRMGLKGPYSVVFSRSAAPAANGDLSFMANMGLTGYVATSARGYVSGKGSGVAGSTYQIVVHWYNSAAQYWAIADSSTNNFYSPAMKPGTYTMVLYQGELAVATHTGVVVSAGSTLSHNIASTWTTPATTLLQVGNWDGQPTGFRNAANQLRMHPSDSRMSAWGPLTYAAGGSLSGFPMAIIKAYNVPVTITVSLTAAQASGAATLRVGVTLSFAGCRPIPTINSWTGSTPAAPTTIDSRGFTRGAYRGWNDIYTWSVPAGTLVSGTNTIKLDVASGSSGTGFLAPNCILDAIDLGR